MRKTAFLFPGQGAQYVGMGRSFYEKYDAVRQYFKTAQEVTGIDVAALCFEENEALNQTEYTQIAMYTTECAILHVLQEKRISYEAAAGLSLGEYAALTAAGALSFKDGCHVIRRRGIYMEQAVPEGQGSMAAVLGLSAKQTEEVLKTSLDTAKIGIANYNCPGQIVISGEKGEVERAAEVLKQAGAKRVVPLRVSGPFHSPLLYGAGEQLQKELGKITFNKIQIPYIANLTAEYVTDSKEIPELLRKQVYSPVRFEQTLRKLITDGFDTFIEIGPGRTLTGFVKKTAKEMQREGITCINIENEEDLSQLITE